MTLFMNSKEDIVNEAVDGLIACSGGRLARLDGYPHIRAVVRCAAPSSATGSADHHKATR